MNTYEIIFNKGRRYRFRTNQELKTVEKVAEEAFKGISNYKIIQLPNEKNTHILEDRRN